MVKRLNHNTKIHQSLKLNKNRLTNKKQYSFKYSLFDLQRDVLQIIFLNDKRIYTNRFINNQEYQSCLYIKIEKAKTVKYPFLSINIINKMLELLIIFLTATTANCNIQDGTWQSNYTNSNFLFSFLQANNGTASVHTQERTLYVYLQSQKQNGRIIKMQIDTLTPAYVTDAVYQDFNKSIKIAFLTDNQVTYSNQQAKASKIFYNITLNHRSKLQLISAEGQFTIQLIDIEILYPQLLMQLNIVFYLIIFFNICNLVKIFFILYWQIKFTELLGYFSNQIIVVWSYKCLEEIYVKSKYFSSTNLRFLSNIGMPIIIQIYFLMLTMLMSKVKTRLFLIRIIFCVGQAFLMFELVKIRLMHLIIASCLYQLVTALLNVNLKINMGCIISHIPLYLLPIAVFPYFSQQINYPKGQAACWWFYLTSFAFQVVIYIFKSNKGFWINIKRCIFYVQKWRKINSYMEITDNICPVCLQEIEIEKDAVSDAIAAGVEKTYVKNSCNHYFHKECITNQSVQEVCFFDDEKWSPQLKKKRNDLMK